MAPRKLSLLLILAAAPAWADISFDLWEYYDGNRLFINHPLQIHRKVYISGGKMAIVENNFVQYSDLDNDVMLLIDHQTKRYARMGLKDAQSMDHQGYLNQVGTGTRMTVVEADVPDKWNEHAVVRTVAVSRVPGAKMGLPDMEIRITSLAATDLPGWQETKEKYKGDGARFDQELNALIETMAAPDLDYSKDVRTARSKVDTKALPVRTVSEVRFIGDAKLTDDRLSALQGKVLMRKEEDLSNISGDPVDPTVFWGPPAGYQEAPMPVLLQERAQRNGK